MKKPILFILLTGSIVIFLGILVVYNSYQKKARELMLEVTPTPTPEAPLLVEAKKSIEQVNKQQEKEPKNPALIRKQAQAYYLLGSYQEALNQYLLEETLNMQDYTLYYELGNVYIQLGNVDEAIASFEKSIAIEPKNNQSFIALASMYTNHRPDKEKVIGTYSRGVSENPQDISLRILFAGFYEQIGDTSNALQQYNEILTLQPENTIAKMKIQNLKTPTQ